MSAAAAAAIAADGATTNWRTYDGAVPAKFTFYVVLFPLLMFTILALPTMACYWCLGAGKRGAVAQYFPPNYYRSRAIHGMFRAFSLAVVLFVVVVCNLVANRSLFADHRSTYQGTIEHGFHHQPEKF